MVTTTTPRIIRYGAGQARVARWQGEPDTARLVIAPTDPDVAEPFLRHCLARLQADGFRSVLTGALTRAEQAPFLRAGFREREQLLVLARDVDTVPPAPAVATRAGRKRDRDAVLAVDSAAFPPLWRLDEATLAEALEATPQTRFRIAGAEGGFDSIAGYAITGRAGRRGYLQRLAVVPAERGRGVGTALVVDGLRWLRRWRVSQVLVNTQVDNEPALSLYRSLGFTLERFTLSVLVADLD